MFIVNCRCYQASGSSNTLAHQKSRSRHKTQVDMDHVHQAHQGLSLQDPGAQGQRVQRNDHLQLQAYKDQMWASQQEMDYPCLPHSEDLQPANNRELKQSHTRRDCGAQVNHEDMQEQRHQVS